MKLVESDNFHEYAADFFKLNADPPISISPTWARYLNPVTTSTNTTALAHILTAAGVWNTATTRRASPADTEVIVESILSALVTNAIGRTNYDRTLRWDLLKGVAYPSDIRHGSGASEWTREFIPKGNGLGLGGEAFFPPEADASTSKWDFIVKVQGYAYSPEGVSQVATMAVLGVYVLLVLGHLVYSVGTGWSSAGWGSPMEVAALALSSERPGAAGNTGAGIETARLFSERVRVREMEGSLEMVFGEGEKGGYNRVEVGRMYG
jgi:hypothetical protein